MSNENLPSYLSAAKPNPASNRAAWFKNTAPAYAGVMLWFAFWNGIPAGTNLSQGVLFAVVSVVAMALISFAFFYLVPGMFGMKTGLPLYVVGSSIFGTKGGIVMPGLFMGLLQFGWVAVNIFFSSTLIAAAVAEFCPPTVVHILNVKVIMVIWGVLATFMGLMGIKYVAKISTFLPLIPFVILIILAVKTFSGVSTFDPAIITKSVGNVIPAASPITILTAMTALIVGFFATAGAAGVDFGTGARNRKDVFMGGFVGVALTMIFAGVLSVLIVAGAYGMPAEEGKEALSVSAKGLVGTTDVMGAVLGSTAAKICMLLLALAAFPAACFSAFIAANSFKNMLPNINANISVSIGGIAAIILAVAGYAGNAEKVFGFIGASFGPICGAMLVDYFMNGCKWSGPRAGFNIAGWASWAIGFIVGTINIIMDKEIVPCATISAFIVGAIVYLLCNIVGLKSKVIETDLVNK